MDIKKFPKIELHRHLEGALRLQTVLDLAEEENTKLPCSTVEELSRIAQVLSPMKTLQEVLDAFHIFQKTFCSYRAVERIAFEAVEDAARDNICLLELRFSPDFMARGFGLDWDRMMESLIQGVERAQKMYPIEVGLICIISRTLGVESAKNTVDFCVNWKSEMVGFDLADAEELWGPEVFKDFLIPLHQHQIPITVHSGENTPSEYIKKSIDLLGARRIGHGISLIDDLKLVDQVVQERIAIEMCPTSNVRTSAVSSIEAHPAHQLLKLGVPVTLNSDDPGLFGITLSGELELAQTCMGFSDKELMTVTEHAWRASFVELERKVALLKQTTEWTFGTE